MYHLVYTSDTVYGSPEFMSFKAEDDLMDFVNDEKNYVERVYNVYIGTCDKSMADELEDVLYDKRYIDG